MRHPLLTTLTVLLLTACTTDSSHKDYEQGLLLMEQGDAPQALQLFKQAADRATDDSLLAAVYSDMGRLLFFEGLQEQAFSACGHAFDVQTRRNDTVGMTQALFDMANICRAREVDDSCLYYYDKALALAYTLGDSMLATDIRSQQAGFFLWHKDYDRARDLLAPALAKGPDSLTAGVRFMAADMYHHTGEADSARLYCQSLLGEDDVVLRQMGHKWMAEQLLAEGKSSEAIHHLEQYELLTDTLMEETDTEAMRRISALYDYNRHQQQAAHMQRHAIIAIATAVILLCLLAAVMLYYSRRRLHYQLKVHQLEQLLADYERRDQQKTDRQQQILSTTPIQQRIEQLLADPRHPPMTTDDWRILEATIDKIYPGFTERLRTFYRFSPQERHVNLLLKLGVPPAGIAQLTAHAKQSVTSVRSRLYAKVFGRKGTPAEWDAFIRSL